MADTGGPRRPLFPAPSASAAPTQADGFGLAELVRVFRRRLWVFLSVAGATVLIMAFVVAGSPRIYIATSQIQLDLRERRAVADLEAVVSGLPPDTATVDTETKILKSRKVAERVVDTLRLTEDPDFVPPPKKPGPIDWLKGLFSQPKPPPSAAAVAAANRQIAVGALERSVDVQRAGLTYIIDISARSEDADKAARIANAYAEAYLTQQLEAKYDAIQRVNEWLSTRLTALREEVRTKERAVEAARSEGGLLSAEGSTLTEQSLVDTNAQLVEARATLAEREARLRAAESGASGGRADAVEEALQSPVIANLRQQQAELARQKAELSAKYDWKHPEIRRITDEIADIDSRVEQEVNRVLAGLRNQVEVARQRVASIEASLDGQRGRLVDNNVAAVQLRELDRDAEASRVLYESFLNRAKQVAEQVGIEQADATIVSRASPPLWPSLPNTTLMYALGVVLGALLGTGAVVLMELLETSLRTPDDVQARLKTTCLGRLPRLDKKTRTIDGDLISPENFVVKRPLSPFGEALRGLRASAFFSNPERPIKVLAVTSAVPGEGKTTTATGLARISALAGSKTVLVDCDLRRRSATHVLGLHVEQGLAEVLLRSAELNDVIQTDPASGMDVVPLAQAEFTPRDLLGTQAMAEMLDQLRARYEVVILDTAPVLPLSDTRVLSPFADGVLVVARWGKTPSAVVGETLELLRGHGARVLGVALDGVDRGVFGKLVYDRPEYYADLYNTYYVR